MRILSVNNTADMYGASRCLAKVFGRIAEEGHDVHVVLPQVGSLANVLEARGVTVHIHKGLCIIERARLRTLTGFISFVLSFPYSTFWLAVLIVRLRIDVVHSNTVVMPSPAVAAFITRRKHIWHVRELLAEFGSLWKPYQRYIHSLSSAIVTISDCTREQFDPRLRDIIRVIYDGIDESDGTPDPYQVETFRRQFSPSARLVGTVGRIKWHRKGQEVLVRAARLLRPNNPLVHYVFVGSPAPGNESHFSRLRELIEECEVGDIVTLIGDVKDPSHVFAALDVAVVPSVQPEPFGCVVMEAMAVGTPVVGSRCGGIAEQISDGSTGLLFPPGDDRALAEALEKLLNDESLRLRVGENGRNHAWNNFHLDGTCRGMSALFKEVEAGRFCQRSISAIQS